MQIILTPNDVHTALAQYLQKDPASFVTSHKEVRKGNQPGIYFTVDTDLAAAAASTAEVPTEAENPEATETAETTSGSMFDNEAE